jgi:hypothetical protein
VFNGNGQMSADRLKVYVNGENSVMTYRPWGINAG